MLKNRLISPLRYDKIKEKWEKFSMEDLANYETNYLARNKSIPIETNPTDIVIAASDSRDNVDPYEDFKEMNFIVIKKLKFLIGVFINSFSFSRYEHFF